jgi:uncharacterized protein YndB with AHSA1/START domain
MSSRYSLAMPEILVQREVPAEPESVWEVYTDHLGWPEWAGVKEVVLRREGEPAPNGVGASRVIRAGGIAIEEEIVAFDPPRRMAYQLIAGAPIRDHRGEVLFEPTPTGTLVSWRVSFRPRIPFTGGLLARALEKNLQGILEGLAGYPFGATSA